MVSNKFGRLVHGNKYNVVYIDTIGFIAKQNIPSNKKVTYALFLFEYCPLKTGQYRCCIVVSDNKLNYHQDVASPTASLTN